VRYHLSGIPTNINPKTYRLSLVGKVQKPLSLSLTELKTQFKPTEIVAVNQCSGNSRGFMQPRVGGGQLGNGAMGNARWKGVALRDILKKAGLTPGAQQITFEGLDVAPLKATPSFVKALPIDHAMDGEVMLAYSMNGEDLPFLNGFPVRLVVPGYFGTYWVKHLKKMTVIDHSFQGYWMETAYRIPDNSCACVPPGTKPDKTVPIGRLPVRSFITNVSNGAVLQANQNVLIKGIAFDGGHGIQAVEFSADGGQSWKETTLGRNLGKYSFREWQTIIHPKNKGTLHLKVRATNTLGHSQPLEPLWNPAGYMRNVVETVQVEVA
jgi:DMSO/TMAO reductase YedYZ molybdopterin-dependent catalytic subunit